MTNQEAIHIIENVNANTNCDNCFYKYDVTCEDCRVETALNMAIEALANQKKGEQTMTKEEALKWLDTIMTQGEQVDALEMAIEALENQNEGHWIFKNDNIAIPTGYYQCSECEEGKLLNKDNFCPNCGAKMKEE